jgi:hypothetical protein
MPTDIARYSIELFKQGGGGEGIEQVLARVLTVLAKKENPAWQRGSEGRSGWLGQTPGLRPGSIKPHGSIVVHCRRPPIATFP